MAPVGGLGLARVDADQPGTVALGFLSQTPEMQVAGDRIAAPDQDQARLGEELHLHPDLAAQSLGHCLAAGRRTDGSIQQRRAEPMEEARRHAFALDQAHGAAVAVRQDRLRVARRDLTQAGSNVVQRLAPFHRLVLARPLRPDPFERSQQPLGVVAALGVARDLGAKDAVGRPMRRIALHLDRDASAHSGHQGAGVRAVMGTGAPYFVGRSVGARCGNRMDSRHEPMVAARPIQLRA
jgi:hypothetical protein